MIQKIKLLLLALVVGVGFSAVAQEAIVTDVVIDAKNQELSGVIPNTVKSGEISIWFENDTGDSGLEFTTVPWQASSFSVVLQDWDIASNAITSPQGRKFSRIVFSSPANPNSKTSLALSSVVTGAKPAVSIDFPGWEKVIINELPNSGGKYYPIIKSKQTSGALIKRNPATANLSLVIHDTTTGTYGLLQNIPGGSEYLNVTFQPNCSGAGGCTLPTIGRLDPGTEYAIFLSDDFNSETKSGTAVQTSGEPTLKYFTTPDPASTNATEGSITITSAKLTENNTSLKINATAKPGFVGQVEFKIVGKDKKNTNEFIQISLGTMTNPSGNFVFPQAPQKYNLGGFDTYTVQAVVGNTLSSEFKITENASTDNDGASNQGNTSASIYTAAQEKLLNTGLAPNCGYKLGKKFPKEERGRICGFSDLITLIQNVIEYIFILTVPIIAIVFAYAGYLYLTSAGDSGKRTQAKNAMINVVIGIVVVMSAWLLVTLIVKTLGASSDTTQFLDI